MAPDGGDHEVIEDNVIVAREYRQAVQLGSQLGTRFSHNTVIGTDVHMDSKSGGIASRDGTLRDNILVGGMFGTSGGSGCAVCSITHNLFDSAGNATGSSALIGMPLFTGGASPATYAGFELATGAWGRLVASDGADRGARFRAAAPPPATPRPVLPPPTPVPPAPPVPPQRPAPTAPVASYTWTPTSPRVGGATTFRSTSAGSGALSCAWHFTNRSGGVVYMARSGCTLRYAFTSSGTKYVRLTVTDADGDRDRVTHLLMVRATQMRAATREHAPRRRGARARAGGASHAVPPAVE
jgi:hypothetical protein